MQGACPACSQSVTPHRSQAVIGASRENSEEARSARSGGEKNRRQLPHVWRFSRWKMARRPRTALSKGGQCSVNNCLPICTECNRLRWSYSPRLLRLMLLFGRYAKQKIRGKNGRDTELGERLIQVHIRNTWSNDRRRRRPRA